MSYWSAAVVAIVVPLGWSLTGIGCSDSGNGGNPDAAAVGGNGDVKPCVSDKDCRDLGLLCDTQRSVCAECVTALDCGDSDAAVYECKAGKCATYVACANSLMCPNGQVCDKQRTRCVDCTQDADCPMGGKCVGDQCRKGCASDKDCVVDGLLCDFTSSSCVNCLKSSDCGDGGLSCISGSCQKELCTPGTTSCLGGGVATCAPSGDGWGNIVLCDAPCSTVGGVARCGGSQVVTMDASRPAQGCGSPDLIDDMEDGDGYICRANGRVGQWYTYGSNITPLPPGPPPANPVSPSAIVPPRPTSNYAMHLMGSSLTTVVGSALGVDLQLDGATYGTYDASAYTGISFVAKGNVAIDVLVDSAPTTIPMNGGTCVTTCTPSRSSVSLTSTWAQYKIPFDTFLAGNGGLTAIDKSSLTHIQFRVLTAAIGTDVWIDDLSFLH